MFEDNSGILSMVIFTNTSVQNFAVRITSPAETKRFVNKFYVHVSSLLVSSLCDIVIHH